MARGAGANRDVGLLVLRRLVVIERFPAGMHRMRTVVARGAVEIAMALGVAVERRASVNLRNPRVACHALRLRRPRDPAINDGLRDLAHRAMAGGAVAVCRGVCEAAIALCDDTGMAIKARGIAGRVRAMDRLGKVLPRWAWFRSSQRGATMAIGTEHGLLIHEGGLVQPVVVGENVVEGRLPGLAMAPGAVDLVGRRNGRAGLRHNGPAALDRHFDGLVRIPGGVVTNRGHRDAADLKMITFEQHLPRQAVVDPGIVEVEPFVVIESDTEKRLHIVPELGELATVGVSLPVGVRIVDDVILRREPLSYDVRRIAALDDLGPGRVVRRQQDRFVVGRVQAVHSEVIPRKDHVLGVVSGNVVAVHLRSAATAGKHEGAEHQEQGTQGP